MAKDSRHMANTTHRSDPIHGRYFVALDKADIWANRVFYFTALVSVVVLFVERSEHPLLFSLLNVVFALAVVAVFGIGLAVRLYWMPRADAARLQDFFAKAYDIPLTHITTTGYYNNDATDAVRRVAAQALENALFSKSIALKMLFRERWRAVMYAAVWALAAINRTTDIGLVVGFSQIVFSEQIVSRWFRLEWLRQKFEVTYSTLYQLFQSDPTSSASFRAQAVAAFVMYESAKANTAVTLSSDDFHELNPTLTVEWEQVKKALNI